MTKKVIIFYFSTKIDKIKYYANYGDIMITINSLLIYTMCLFFPISLYLNYLSHIKIIEKQEKQIIFEFTIIASFILIIRFNPITTILLIPLLTIPIVIAILNRNIMLSTILEILLIVSIDFKFVPFVMTKYVLCLIFHYHFKNQKQETIAYIAVEMLTLILLANFKISIDLIIIMLLFILYLKIIMTLLKKGNQNLELSQVLEELEHEKLLRSSISKLTHELKNPIAVCQGYLEMIDSSNQQKLTKYLGIISEEINRSKNIIDEFSTYGKLKKIELEEMDICLLFEDIEHLLYPLFKSNKATLNITKKEELYIYGDYNKLKQVFINLLKNTLEAKKEQESLIVDVIITNTKNKIKIIVQDNGVGMTEETLLKASEIFYTTKANGTGIGLAFSKEVINLHNGSLTIHSKENVGTTITITLPKEKKSEDFNSKNYLN